MAEGYDRFRSFAERYLVARAERFDKGTELEEGWRAIQDARKLYAMTAHASVGAEPSMPIIPEARDAANAPNGAATQTPISPGAVWTQQRTTRAMPPPTTGLVTQQPKGQSNGTPRPQQPATKTLRQRIFGP